METKARYLLVGSFVLVATLAIFAFIYWLHNTGGLGERDRYRIRFAAPVSGLLKGSSVLFNGIRVGEVTEIRLSPDAPKDVLVTIGVDPATPIRADTVVSVDFQGLTGAPVIGLRGGEANAAPLSASAGDAPLLTASPDASLSLTESARGTLQRLDKVLDENSAALKETISGFSTFAGVLSRNSERIDGILAGLERFAGGGAAKPGIYTLTAFDKALCETPSQPQLAIPEPTAPMAFNSDRVVVMGDPPADAPFAEAQFTDNAPAVIQGKLIESLEHTKCFSAVGRPAFDSPEASAQLQAEVRRFAVTMKPAPTADVEIALKIASPAGKITEQRVFHESAPLAAVDSQSAVNALDAAFGKILAEAVPWLTTLSIDAAPAKADDGDFPDFPEPPPAEPAEPEPPAP